LVVLPTVATDEETGEVSDIAYEAMPWSESVQFMTKDDVAMEAAGMERVGLVGVRVLTVVVAA